MDSTGSTKKLDEGRPNQDPKDGNAHGLKRSSLSYEGSLIQFLKEHPASSLLSDFTICSGDKQEFKCSRLVLAARSKYYQALFRQEPSKTLSELDLNGWLVG